MVNKLFALVVVFLTMGFQCYDCDEFVRDEADVIINIDAGGKRIFRGDTIAISSIFSSQLESSTTNEVYDNSNAPISYRFCVYRRDPFGEEMLSGTGNIELVNLQATADVSPVNPCVDVRATCEELECNLTVGLVPLNLGLYVIQVRGGFFGEPNECERLSLRTLEIQDVNIEGNNFQVFEEKNINSIGLGGTFYRNPETQEGMFFFEVE